MDLFEPYVNRSGVTILDGALATELERRGADLNNPLWSARVLLEAPELIREVHLDYFRAGADVATTASYQATSDGFLSIGLQEPEAVQLMMLSVQLACEARNQYWLQRSDQQNSSPPLVAASVGPYGAFLADGGEYRGDYDLNRQQLKAFHRRKIEILLEASPDLLVFETVPCRKEGEALVELISEFPQARAWLSFSCRDEKHVSHGELFRDCVALANDSPQIIAVGLNCTAPRYVESLLQSASGVTDRYLVAYPNSGEGWDAHAKRWTPAEENADLGTMARRWYSAGARLIGGCCRTTPEDIRTIASEFETSSESRRTYS
jgi:homocysteine S-methyltransferase